MAKKMVNGVLIDLTPEEENQRTIDAQNWENLKAEILANKEAKDALKASAKAKLIAGEPLTEDEANTVVL